MGPKFRQDQAVVVHQALLDLFIAALVLADRAAISTDSDALMAFNEIFVAPIVP